jgi:hypothetical protein
MTTRREWAVMAPDVSTACRALRNGASSFRDARFCQGHSMTIDFAGHPLGHPDVRDRLAAIANARGRQLHPLPVEVGDLHR